MNPLAFPVAVVLLAAPLDTAAPTAAVADVETTAAARLAVDAVRARLPDGTDDAQRDALVGVVAALRSNDAKLAAERWSSFVMTLVKAGGAMDIDALISWVLRQSYLETNKDLQLAADKVKYFNVQKDAVRDYTGVLRSERKGLGEGASKELATIRLGPKHTLFAAAVTAGGKQSFTLTTLDAAIATMESKLSSIGDDAELANAELQEVLRHQQQTLQMISNISQMLYDIATSAVRKLGG